MHRKRYVTTIGMTLLLCAAAASSKDDSKVAPPADTKPPAKAFADPAKFVSQPIVTHIYTADPSAHVFKNKLYIYPSHDIESGIPEDDLGSHFAMRDYHVLSMDKVGGPIQDHGVAL